MIRPGLLALLTIGLGLADAPRTGAPEKPATLRVLCYNIHHGEGADGKVDLPRLAKVIRDARPDLVALQEVDNKTRRTNGVDQTAELARLTGLHGTFGRQIDYEGGQYGQAVLSRYPIASSKVHVLPGEPPREGRMAFEVSVVVDGTPLRFATTHLHHINAAFRERQAAEINRIFADSAGPAILAGDMNAVPGSPPIARLLEAWTPAAGARALPTYPSEKPAKAIDHIFMRNPGRLRVAGARVLAEPLASDHSPLLATFEWAPRP